MSYLAAKSFSHTTLRKHSKSRFQMMMEMLLNGNKSAVKGRQLRRATSGSRNTDATTYFFISSYKSVCGWWNLILGVREGLREKKSLTTIDVVLE